MEFYESMVKVWSNLLGSMSQMVGFEVSTCMVVGTIALLPLVSLVVYVLLNRGRPRTPKGYVRVDGSRRTVEESKERDCTRDNFAVKKIPENLDFIVVGSGLGGLVCGAYLSRVGKKVLVLEQHYIAGGMTHDFEDKNFKFETGVHYIGDAGRLGMVLDPASLPQHRVKLHQMGEEKEGFPYDSIIVGDAKPHLLRPGFATWRGDLVKRFPEEEAAIDAYIEQIKQALRAQWFAIPAKFMPMWLVKLIAPCFLRKYHHFVSQTPIDILNTLTTNQELIAILTGQCGDVGSLPHTIPFIHFAGLHAHYFQGGYFPVGGGLAFPRALIPTIEENGGRVLVRAAVEQILLDEKHQTAIGVKLKKCSIFAREGVICGTGLRVLLNRLLNEAPDVVNRFPVQKHIKELGLSPTHFYVFAGFNAPPAELNLPSYNLWIQPTEANFNVKGHRDRFNETFWDDPTLKPMMFLTFPSAKDPQFAVDLPGKSTCIVITETPYEWFAAWEEGRQGARGEEYEEKKMSLANRLMEDVYTRFPQLKGKLQYLEAGSPLSGAFYYGNEFGESYGLAFSKLRSQLGPLLRPETVVKKLWVTGQDYFCNGIFGASMSGALTAHSILGYGTLLDALTGRLLMTDVASLDPTLPPYDMKKMLDPLYCLKDGEQVERKM